MVPHIKGITEIEGVCDQGAKGINWTSDVGHNRRLEKTA
jgi:hypothetical protein